MFLLLLFSAMASAAATEITYIGDSQSASEKHLFAELKNTISSAGHISTGRAVCGARIDEYLSADGAAGQCGYPGVKWLNIENAKDQFIPGPGHTFNVRKLAAKTDLVIVQLGDNHLGDPDRGAALAKEMATQLLTDKKKCVWIGPASVVSDSKNEPDRCKLGREVKMKTSAAIKASLESTNVKGKKCSYVDSFSLTDKTPPKSGDCLHYSDYTQWANPIREALKKALSNSSAVAEATK